MQCMVLSPQFSGCARESGRLSAVNGGGGKSGLLHLQSVPHSIGDPLPILQQARHKERDFLGAKLSEIILRLLGDQSPPFAIDVLTYVLASSWIISVPWWCLPSASRISETTNISGQEWRTSESRDQVQSLFLWYQTICMGHLWVKESLGKILNIL